MAESDWHNIKGFGPSYLLGLNGKAIATESESSFEAAIESGIGFTLTSEFTVPNGGTTELAFITPAGLEIHLKNRVITANGGVTYKPYSGGTYTPGADRGEAINLNSLLGGVPAARIHDMTSVSAAGSSFDVVKVYPGQGNSTPANTFSSQTLKRILAKSTVYLLEFTNTDSADVDVTYTLSWVERPNGHSAPAS